MQGDLALENRDLLVENVDLPQASVDGLALIARQLDAGEPHAAALAEGVRHWRAALEVAHQDGMHLVLAARPVTNELGAASKPATQRSRALVR
jgi:hypothetical protein